MRINISKYFRKALERHRAVSVRGLGQFTLTHRSAELDHSREAVKPPSDAVSFDAEGAGEEIVFSEFLEDMLDVPSSKAKELVRRWTDGMNEGLKQEGQIELSGLGVLHLSGDELEWVPRKGADFALQAPWPVLYFKPLRAERTAAAGGKQASERKNRSLLFWIAGAAAVIMLFLAFAYWTFYQTPDKPVDWSDIDQSRVNKSPMIDSYYVRDTHLPPETTAQRQNRAREHMESVPGGRPDSNDHRSPKVEKEAPVEERKTESPHPMDESAETPSPDCVVVVGAFARENNVVKMLDLLEERGYTTYTEAHDSLTRVGVRTPCVNESLLNTLRACRSGVEENAWILGRRPQ